MNALLSPDVLPHKLKASTIHMGLGTLVLLPVLWLIAVQWYPGPLFWSDGGWQGAKIMLLVDLVLGPTLTFMVYHPQKARRSLYFDFSVIALLQVSAFVYGLYQVHLKRPCAVAWYDGAFQVTTCDVFQGQSIAADGWQALGAQAPYWVWVREAKGQEKAGVIAFEMTQGLTAADLHFLYDPLLPHLGTLKPQWPASLQPLLPALQAQYPQAKVLPLLGYYQNAVVVLGPQGQVLTWQRP